jgi:DNA-binding NarL/FixJ family response regulator
MAEEIRIMILDDHDTFRDPLAFMLEREPDLTVVARPRSLSEARGILESAELAVDVAIVDLNLPDGSGADLIKDLRASRPRAKALVLSAMSEQRYLAEAIEAGAAGVMHKSTPMRDLTEAVRQLAAGEQLLSQQEVIEALRFIGRERESNREARLAIGRLTPREREVLKALAEGLSDKEIAQRLHVGEGTVPHPRGEHPLQARGLLEAASASLRRAPRRGRDRMSLRVSA